MPSTNGSKSAILYARVSTEEQAKHRAPDMEAEVWDLVSTLIQNPEELRRGLDAMIEEERNLARGNPDEEWRAWSKKLSEVEDERRGYLRLAARGSVSDAELDEALAELDSARNIARRELKAIEGHRERIEQLERDRDEIMDQYAGMTPEALQSLSPEDRNQLYRILKLRVIVDADGSLEVSGPFENILGLCKTDGSAQ